MPNTTKTTEKKNNKRLLTILTCITLGMFGFGYLMVPLYNVLCSSLGINGKTAGKTAMSTQIDETRTVMIQFMSVRNSSIPWIFRPKQRTVSVHPGQNKQVAFYAENTTPNTMIVQAIPSVSPGIAAKYLKKTECFCFTRQKMKGHLGMDWPILFHIDKGLPKNIHTITLAYTLFDLTNSPIKAKTTTNVKKGGHFVVH